MTASGRGGTAASEHPTPQTAVGQARPEPIPVDVVVVGGGLVGLTMALALARGAGGTLTVAVVDPAGGAAARDGRASAIAAGARRMLETLGAWLPVARTQPILDMVVTDGRVTDGVRPTILSFAGDAEPGEPFAHMIENADLIGNLAEACRAAGVTIFAARVTSTAVFPSGVDVTLSAGPPMRARLVAGCDGARSALREAAGIRMVGWDYGQSGIVLTVRHERPHGGRAEEHFLPAGPFAILPLVDDGEGRHRSSLVWTESTADARRIVAADPETLRAELLARFGHHLGAVEIVDRPRAYPLGLKLARRFVAERLALVGDAAHVVHPIAGQGLNLGLRDAAVLAEVVVDAARVGLDIGAGDVLERYERWRRFDTVAMGVATDSLNRLFSNDFSLLRGARDFGLGVVERLPGLKQLFIRSAAGLVGDVPRLMRGEPL